MVFAIYWPLVRRSTGIVCPSSRRHISVGVGCPLALHVSVIFEFSLTATVLSVDRSSNMFGGTARFNGVGIPNGLYPKPPGLLVSYYMYINVEYMYFINLHTYNSLLLYRENRWITMDEESRIMQIFSRRYYIILYKVHIAYPAIAYYICIYRTATMYYVLPYTCYTFKRFSLPVYE